MFKGVCPVINVSFNPDYSIDFEGLNNIVDYVVEQKCESMCLFAFNSEPYKISFTEKKKIISAFLKAVNKRAETLIGIVENSIGDCIELGLTAKNFGADGIILYPPALSTPNGDELINYFKTIADAVDLKVMIQDNPRSTGVNMSLEFLLDAYKKIPQFDYIKVECPIPMRKMKKIIKATEGKLKCYSGNGGIFAVDAFLQGAYGIMPGVVMCGHFNKMYKLMESGNVDGARDMFEKILPFTWYEDQSLEFYISCEKLLLKEMGIIKSDTVRKPNTSLSDSEITELKKLYERTFYFDT